MKIEKGYPDYELDNIQQKWRLFSPRNIRIGASITERLQATEQMKWVGLMNAVKVQV